MKPIKIKNVLLFPLASCFLFLSSCLLPLASLSQTAPEIMSPTQKYEELFKLQPQESIENKIVTPQAQENQVKSEPEVNKVDTKQELVVQNEIVVQQEPLVELLPKLNDKLYPGWNKLNEGELWISDNDNIPDYLANDKDVLKELGISKILRQSYQTENNIVDVVIYKFKDFSGAYSAFTVFHKGNGAKLKVGKHASEAENLINFWKGNYFVDVHASLVNNESPKGFVVLASQEISKNIVIDQIPPVVAIQLPALNRIQGTEKYCLGPLCCKKYFSSIISDIDYDKLYLNDSGGVITAEYQLSESKKNDEKVTLLLTRYISKETAELVFNSLKEKFEAKVNQNKETKENKDMEFDVDLEDSIAKVKNKKNDFTMLKQKGNLFAIAYGITDKKIGVKILDLVPWPIEISKPISSVQP